MAVNLMRTLDQERFDVAAISLYDPVGADLEHLLAHSSIPVWYLGKRRGFDPRMFTRIARIVRYFRPQVVHTHQYVLRYALPPVLRYRTPAVIHTMHNPAEKEVGWLGRWVHRLAFRRGVVPVAIAQEVGDSLRRCYRIRGFPSIYNGVPVDTYRQPLVGREAWRRREGFAQEDTLFVCIARLSAQKNHALLLEAFARGPVAAGRARLLLVGQGDSRSKLEKQAAALGLRDRIHFLGVRTDVPDLLNASDVFVLSSDWEGNPLAIMEAMSAGKAVVSTAVGGVPELIEDGSSGLLVPPGDSRTLAQTMKHMLVNPEARKAIGKAAGARAAERFDVQAMTKAYEGLYEKILAGS